MLLVTGSPHLVACGGPCRHAFTARRVGPVGVLEPGIGASGLPRNLGDPAAPSRQHGRGTAHTKAPGPRVGVGPYGRDEHRRTGWYCQPKDNEGRQEGPQGVGTPHSTMATGDPAPRGPREGKGASGQGAVGGQHAGDTELQPRVHATPTDSGVGASRTGSGSGCVTECLPPRSEPLA